MIDNDDEKTGWGQMLAGGWQKGTKGIKDKITAQGDKLIDKLVKTDTVQEAGAKLIGKGISSVVEDITTNAGSLTKEGMEKLKIDENFDTYQTIRDSLGKPGDKGLKKVWNSILGRVIDIGTGIAGYIGAAFVNVVYNPAEEEKASGGDLHKVFAHFMSKTLGGFKQAPAVA